MLNKNAAPLSKIMARISLVANDLKAVAAEEKAAAAKTEAEKAEHQKSIDANGSDIDGENGGEGASSSERETAAASGETDDEARVSSFAAASRAKLAVAMRRVNLRLDRTIVADTRTVSNIPCSVVANALDNKLLFEAVRLGELPEVWPTPRVPFSAQAAAGSRGSKQVNEGPRSIENKMMQWGRPLRKLVSMDDAEKILQAKVNQSFYDISIA
jgi:hypothetical protein